MEYITIALAKGRLAKKAMGMLEQVGITCEEMKEPDSRKLIFTNEELKFRFFLAKANDVPTYVEYGAADIGIVGKDTILEEGSFAIPGYFVATRISSPCFNNSAAAAGPATHMRHCPTFRSSTSFQAGFA